MSLRTEVLLIVALLVGSAMTAKIQYSRGWTNGAEGDRPKIKINDCLAELTLAQIQKSQFLPPCKLNWGEGHSEQLEKRRFVFPEISYEK